MYFYILKKWISSFCRSGGDAWQWNRLHRAQRKSDRQNDNCQRLNPRGKCLRRRQLHDVPQRRQQSKLLDFQRRSFRQEHQLKAYTQEWAYIYSFVTLYIFANLVYRCLRSFFSLSRDWFCNRFSNSLEMLKIVCYTLLYNRIPVEKRVKNK